MMSSKSPVLIVGAGIAGLSCAVYLKQAGINARVLDAADSVGGRVRTDVVDGFRLDRGFQILLTAYPEARRLLNYEALDLRPFRSGALIRHDEPTSQDPWLKLLNPLHEPLSVFGTLVSPVGTLSDKFRILELVFKTQRKSISEIFAQEPTTTLAMLHEMGFSETMITRFFRPFFGGVFLEDALTTSSNFFEFCFRMFVEGDAAVPARGIGAIADQLAAQLAPDQLRLNTRVVAIDGTTVRLESGESTPGETLTADRVVMAVDAAQAARLTNRPAPAPTAFNHTTCTYFAAPQSPNTQKLLMLNPRRSAAIHNMCVISDVAPDYAPAGQSLISVSTQGLSTVDEAALTARIQRELTDWFGLNGPAGPPAQWRHLRTDHLPQALPAYPPTTPQRNALRLTDTLYQCGDQTAYPSLNAALQTGREVAESIRE